MWRDSPGTPYRVHLHRFVLTAADSCATTLPRPTCSAAARPLPTDMMLSTALSYRLAASRALTGSCLRNRKADRSLASSSSRSACLAFRWNSGLCWSRTALCRGRYHAVSLLAAREWWGLGMWAHGVHGWDLGAGGLRAGPYY
jgi:hypothetical protein